MVYPLIRDIVALARSKASWRESFLYLLRGIIFLPFLSRHFAHSGGTQKEAGGIAPQFDDIYPLF